MRLLLQRILTIGISPILWTWFCFILNRDFTLMQLIVLVVAMVVTGFIIAGLVMDDAPFLRHFLFKTKTIYSEYGTFYLIKTNEHYYLHNLHWYGYERIEWYNLCKIDQNFIDKINIYIKVYAEKHKIESLIEKEQSDSWDKWDGITDQRLRRNKKIDSIIK